MIRNIITLAFSVLCLSACNTSQEKHKTLKLAHGLPETHSVHQGMVYMNERLETLSGGRLSLQIYPGGQLGSETQCIELLQIGSLDITKVSSGALENFVDEYKVFGLPYLFTSREHYFKVLDGKIGASLLKATEPYRFVGLGYYDSGARSFYTVNKPINTPADLKGLKIRVMKTPVSVEMMRIFGGSATPVDWGELYTALQSGVVDGAENNAPSISTAFHHEVCKYYSINEHTMLPDLLIIGTTAWNSLSNQEKEWMSKAMKESVLYQRKLWAAQEQESLEEAKEKGMQINYPDKTPFIEMARPLIDRYKQNEKLNGIITAIQALGQ